MKKVIVAPISMHQDLLENYRKTNPFLDVKIINKETLISDYFGHLLKGAEVVIYKRYDLTYEMICEILQDLPFIENNFEGKFKQYQEFKELLSKEQLFKKDELFEQTYSNKEIIIYGYNEEDRILNHVLKNLKSNIIYQKQEISFSNKNVNTFAFAFDECLYVLNEIARLLDEGVSIGDIFIYNPSENHKYYLEKYCESFGFKINGLNKKSYFSSGLCNEFFNIYNENHDISTSIEQLKDIVKDDKHLDEFIDLVNKNSFNDLPYEKQIELFVYKFKNTYFKNDIYKPAITIINGPIYRENAHIFVMNFSLNSAPAIFKDNLYLSDKEKAGTFIYTSKEKNENARNELLYFLSQNINFYYSRSNLVDNMNSYPTSFINEFGFKIVNNPKVNVFYSQAFLDSKYVDALDANRLYLTKSSELFGLRDFSSFSYLTYDNQFNGVDAINETTPLRLSFSSLDLYYDCPFKYYLSKVLKIDDFEGNFSTKIGTVVHEIFKDQYRCDFDFEKAFENAISSQDFSPAELLLITNLKESIKTASDASRLHLFSYSSNPTVYTEKRVNLEFDKYTTLVGSIDKLVTLDNRYYYVVDYKIGKKTFSPKNLEQGEGSQLVTYMILSDSLEEVDNMQIAGIYYNSVIETKLAIEKDDESLIPSYLKLSGKTLNDRTVIERIDKTLINSDGAQFLNSVKTKKDGNLYSNASLVSSDEFQSYKDIILDLMKRTIISIRNNDFKISPKLENDDENCKYCDFKEICYLRAYQKRKINNSDGGEDNDGME